ncbi:arylsulfatase [Grosmannia clavigera kw1407]|uniref:Arylsulfatase n=1 Tax=Grosmannia clavigera (strain kw1407 / UAMH 11150) TaxID=655863 RepID=F0X787_GROCL|nr:arylsulfatase [Grosmannia clavigera kw1407]EFX06431.1 arylsulfatase [Grosmannia clavigera kw1407]
MKLSAAVSVIGSIAAASSAAADGPEQVPLSAGLLAEHAPRLPDGRKPNIVFIITDDQDLHMQSLDYLPHVKHHLRDHGTLFRRHYCTTSLCCPSRVSLWTGKQAHNTNVTDVKPPHGGYPKFVSQGLNEAYLPVWLQQADYNTYYTGKLFNAHTIDNYDSPRPAGWTGSDFLLDPYTYSYLNATYQRNGEPPVSYEGHYTGDVLAEKALGFLDDATADGVDARPFFLGIAPVAPHSNVVVLEGEPVSNDSSRAVFSAPVAATRHAHLFADVKVPRTPHFNPARQAAGGSWVRQLARQDDANVAYNDYFYRQRLRALQSVDELVDELFARLDRLGLLASTYVFYTTDNGFHIGQHRLQPGKTCGFEEDINIPLIVRGPGVAAGHESHVVTSHIDLAPTLLQLAGVPARADFDGEPIPLHQYRHSGVENANQRHEHVTVEFWGSAIAEGDYYNRFNDGSYYRFVPNNTYKAVRIIGRSYNLYYSVWCSGEHELYDLNTDPYQLENLLADEENGPSSALLFLGHPVAKVVARLDALLLVLKSCRGRTCVRPWAELHPDDDVHSLQDALAVPFDRFYEQEQLKVAYSRCEPGYLVDAEGPQFEHDGVVYRDSISWEEWV